MSQEKKTIIYEAVLCLIDEKKGLSSIKVAEVAKKADIGKSTIYEYFDSKQQMIAESLLYMVKEDAENLQGIINSSQSFKESYLIIINHIGDIIEKNVTFTKFVTLNDSSFAMQGSLRELLHRHFGSLKEKYIHIFKAMIEKGINEGVLECKPARQDLFLAVSNSVMSMILYKKGFEELADMTREEFADKTWQMFIKLIK